MTRLRLNVIDNREQAYANLRVKMAETVVRRLEQRAVPEFEKEAPALAQARGVKRQVRLANYTTGSKKPYAQVTTGPVYLDAFFAEVRSNGGGFPVTFIGGNRAEHANLIEGGRRAISGKRMSWPGRSDGGKGDSVTNSVKAVAGKNIIRDATQTALARASR